MPPRISSPRVSIVVPTYNHAHFLKVALEGVRAQTMADWECIVVNNYSDDDTEAVVAAFADPRIRLVNFRNEGVIAASRNVGLAQARAEWVAFLDSDDVWRPEKLEACLAVADDATDAVSHPENLIRDGQIVGQTKLGSPDRVEPRAMLYGGNFLSPSAILVRREVLERAGGFNIARDVITAEDFDLWLRLAAQGCRFRFVERPLGDYRLHAGQNCIAAARHRDASLKVLEIHYQDLTGKGLRDVVRYRRACALTIYSAGRTLHKAGNRREALGQFVRAMTTYPFEPRILAGLVLAIWRTGNVG